MSQNEDRAERCEEDKQKRQERAENLAGAPDREARIVVALDGEVGVLVEPQLAGKFQRMRDG